MVSISGQNDNIFFSKLKVSLGSSVISNKAVKAPLSWSVGVLAESEVPFAHNVSSVAETTELVGEESSVQGQTSRLLWLKK